MLAATGKGQWRHFGEGPPAATPSSLARDMLARHNAARARVGMPPLAWSDRLAARAQDGRTRSWRAGNSSTVQTRRTARTCSRLRAPPHRPRKLSARGRRNLETTTTLRTDAAACAGTTRKSSGATRKKWDAPGLADAGARCGSAITTRPAIGPAGGPIEAAKLVAGLRPRHEAFRKCERVPFFFSPRSCAVPHGVRLTPYRHSPAADCRSTFQELPLTCASTEVGVVLPPTGQATSSSRANRVFCD
jgi:hypothetical protein